MLDQARQALNGALTVDDVLNVARTYAGPVAFHEHSALDRLGREATTLTLTLWQGSPNQLTTERVVTSPGKKRHPRYYDLCRTEVANGLLFLLETHP
jgi:hypothetical protein